jgi:hypothetical protein
MNLLFDFDGQGYRCRPERGSTTALTQACVAGMVGMESRQPFYRLQKLLSIF